MAPSEDRQASADNRHTCEQGAPARILVVDDHAGVRRGVIRLLATSDDFEVVGEAADGEEAVVLASTLAPDVVLLDLSMPILDGVGATARLTGLPDAPVVVLFTAWADRDQVRLAMRAGAAGHVLKDAAPAELFRVLRSAVTNRYAVVSPVGVATVGLDDSGPPVAAVLPLRRGGGVRWPARLATGAAAVLVLGSAGAAAASEVGLPAPLRRAAQVVGFPTADTKLDGARDALARLDAALRSGDRAAIGAAVDELGRRVGGLTPSEESRLGATGTMSVARQLLSPAPVERPEDGAGGSGVGGTVPAPTLSPPTTEQRAGGGDGGTSGRSGPSGSSGSDGPPTSDSGHDGGSSGASATDSGGSGGSTSGGSTSGGSTSGGSTSGGSTSGGSTSGSSTSGGSTSGGGSSPDGGGS